MIGHYHSTIILLVSTSLNLCNNQLPSDQSLLLHIFLPVTLGLNAEPFNLLSNHLIMTMIDLPRDWQPIITLKMRYDSKLNTFCADQSTENWPLKTAKYSVIVYNEQLRESGECITFTTYEFSRLCNNIQLKLNTKAVPLSVLLRSSGELYKLMDLTKEEYTYHI